MKIDDLLLPGLPHDLILALYSKAPGNEIASGKFRNPESSSCLVANAFGPFFEHPLNLPPLPGLEDQGFPRSVTPEAIVRFPWRGGRHPCLDVLIETTSALIGLESKRYEPFRKKPRPSISKAYASDVWGDQMHRYERLLQALVSGIAVFERLDAAQLIKHAFGLRTAVARSGTAGKRAILYYLYAEPMAWPQGQAITDKDIAAHRAEINHFAETVEGDEVVFRACPYGELLSTWKENRDHAIQAHASALIACFDVTRNDR